VNAARHPPGGALFIDGRWIGKAWPVYLIAAAGEGHGGDIQLGYKLIETAGAAGAEAIALRRGALSDRDVRSLFGHARHVGITALGEPREEQDVDLLLSLDVPGLRLRYPGTAALPLVERAARSGRPVVLSIGGRPAPHAVAELAGAAGSGEAAILAEGEPERMAQCAAAFPGKPAGFALTGRDDGSLAAALAWGACLIEAPHDLGESRGALEAAARAARPFAQVRP
jgi:N-acetylneuraminate synthase